MQVISSGMRASFTVMLCPFHHSKVLTGTCTCSTSTSLESKLVFLHLTSMTTGSASHLQLYFILQCLQERLVYNSRGQSAAFLPQRPWGKYFAALLRPCLKIFWSYGLQCPFHLLTSPSCRHVRVCEITWKQWQIFSLMIPCLFLQQSIKNPILVYVLIAKFAESWSFQGLVSSFFC